jgi:hypothetical protein
MEWGRTVLCISYKEYGPKSVWELHKHKEAAMASMNTMIQLFIVKSLLFFMKSPLLSVLFIY